MDIRHRKTVFVSISTEERAERLKVEGILAYAHEKTGVKWQVQLDPGGLIRRIAGNPQRYGIDGIIAYVTDSHLRNHLSKANCPTVLIEDLDNPDNPIADRIHLSLVCDHVNEGRRAAEYFLGRHFSNFAWVGHNEPTRWSKLRQQGFVAALKERGFKCHAYPTPSGEARLNFSVELPILSDWIRHLPRPCALMACRDSRARQVIVAADHAAVPVPEGVAILGVDDDSIICTTCDPTLSSISTSDRTVGYTAGRALNELMLTRAPGRIIRTHSPHIVTRRSTDAEAIGDPIVARALQYVRTHLSEKLEAEDLARAVKYPRHALQSRVERALGITLGREIRRIRIATAAQMLLATDKSVSEISESCGFASTTHLCQWMRAAYGMTPLVYRKRYLS